MVSIEPNLGGVERALRLLLAVALIAWILRQPQTGALVWAAGLAASFLVLNALLSRCYLWRLLGISTCAKDAEPQSQGTPPR